MGAAPEVLSFRDFAEAHGTTVLGTAPVRSGQARLITRTLPVGTPALTATFTPDRSGFTGSASFPIAFAVDVAPVVVGGAVENITTTVHPGELLISVDNREVVLPSPVMTRDGGRLLTSGTDRGGARQRDRAAHR
ncbi:hypothetical protein Aglo01_52740 [Actinokineospora globicatena]|nr:hypothetical protein Aglo01_52740 [Actinokineospora globicatena]GLW87620.1 hypothetical protein Aglo02_52590 [Actinokineospora globicatena]